MSKMEKYILANGKDDGCIYSEVSKEKYFNEI